MASPSITANNGLSCDDASKRLCTWHELIPQQTTTTWMDRQTNKRSIGLQSPVHVDTSSVTHCSAKTFLLGCTFPLANRANFTQSRDWQLNWPRSNKCCCSPCQPGRGSSVLTVSARPSFARIVSLQLTNLLWPKEIRGRKWTTTRCCQWLS